MLVKMEREAFTSLGDSELGWACIGPTILQVRGKSPTVKNQAYTELTPGQKALFMFRVLYDHARNSQTEFISWLNILLAQPGTWLEIKAGIKYFGDHSLLQLLLEVERYLTETNEEKSCVASRHDLENDPQMGQFYANFCQLAQETVHLIARDIRNKPEEFVSFGD